MVKGSPQAQCLVGLEIGFDCHDYWMFQDYFLIDFVLKVKGYLPGELCQVLGWDFE